MAHYINRLHVKKCKVFKTPAKCLQCNAMDMQSVPATHTYAVCPHPGTQATCWLNAVPACNETVKATVTASPGSRNRRAEETTEREGGWRPWASLVGKPSFPRRTRARGPAVKHDYPHAADQWRIRSKRCGIYYGDERRT